MERNWTAGRSFLRPVARRMRSLARSPGFTLAALASVALGIGANVAIFGIVEAALFRPLPYDDPASVVRIWETGLAAGQRFRGSVSVPNLVDWRRESRTFAFLGGYRVGGFNVAEPGQGAAVRARGASLTPEILPVLGVPPALGRWLDEGDAAEGASPVVILSDGQWRSRFPAEAAAPERVLGDLFLRIDGVAHRVIGVMPPDFEFPARSGAEMWRPLTWSQSLGENRGSHWLAVIGRLAPGVSVDSARAEMDGIAAQIAKDHPATQGGRGVELHPLPEATVASQRPRLLALWAAVGLVLLIACGNLANLMLVRSTRRRKELAVRSALGAGPLRLAGPEMGEALLLSVGGAILGVLGALVLGRAVVAMPGSGFPSPELLTPRVLLLAIGATLLTAFAGAVLPVLRTTRSHPARALRRESAATVGASRDPFRQGLLVSEIALATVVVVAATLLAVTVRNLEAVDPGFAQEGVVTLRLTRPDEDLSAAVAFFERLDQQVRSLPGVEAAGSISLLPSQQWGWNGDFHIEGRSEPQTAAEQPFAEVRRVTPGYFRALEIPLLDGRSLEARDDGEAPLVALVNRALADKYWPGESALGRRFSWSHSPQADNWVTIVGVVDSVRSTGLDEPPRPEIYHPLAQRPVIDMTLVVRSGRESDALLSEIRAEVRAIDPAQPVYKVRTMKQVVGDFLAGRRSSFALFSVFAVLALVLAMAGTFGVLSFGVSQRTREIGVRMSLGARPVDVISMVVRQGLALGVAGSAVGLALAAGLTFFLESQLFGVGRLDPRIFLAAALVLVATAASAAYFPALRAAKVNPLEALRSD